MNEFWGHLGSSLVHGSSLVILNPLSLIEINPSIKIHDGMLSKLVTDIPNSRGPGGQKNMRFHWGNKNYLLQLLRTFMFFQ